MMDRFVGELNDITMKLHNYKKKADDAIHLAAFKDKDLKSVDKLTRPIDLFSKFIGLSVKVR